MRTLSGADINNVIMSQLQSRLSPELILGVYSQNMNEELLTEAWVIPEQPDHKVSPSVDDGFPRFTWMEPLHLTSPSLQTLAPPEISEAMCSKDRITYKWPREWLDPQMRIQTSLCSPSVREHQVSMVLLPVAAYKQAQLT